MGPIDEKALDFGGPRVTSAQLVAPPIKPPCFGVGISGFSGTLTLSSGVFHQKDRQRVLELFDKVAEELPG